MLVSYVNTKLRDDYPSLDELCAYLGVSRDDVEKKLQNVGFEYLPEINQFR